MALETSYRIEPCFLEHPSPVLVAYGSAIRSSSAVLGAGLHEDTAEALAHAVRIADTRFSHLIEGIDVAPETIIDANWSLGEIDHPADVLACAAYVRERWHMDRIVAWYPDEGRWRLWSVAERLHDAVFRRLGLESAGYFRSDASQDVAVGRHLPPSSAVVGDFMDHLVKRAEARSCRSDAAVFDIPAVHHRFCYVHPFVDGNGRTARLLSWEMIGQAGLRGRSLWSLSRGLCGSDRGAAYLRMMEAADALRRGDLDGRGHLSATALEGFCAWFARLMQQEILFSVDLADPQALEGRLLAAVSKVGLGERALYWARRAFRGGSFSVDAVIEIASGREAIAKEVSAIRDLRRHGFLWLAKEGPLEGLHLLRFPLSLRDELLPGLFDTPGDGITDLRSNMLAWWEMDDDDRLL